MEPSSEAAVGAHGDGARRPREVTARAHQPGRQPDQAQAGGATRDRGARRTSPTTRSPERALTSAELGFTF